MSYLGEVIEVVPSPSVDGLVSVVIPVGQVDVWLDEAVESVLASDFTQFELLAVFNNGAVPPKDWRFLRDSRVKVLFSERALGTGGAGQMGLEAARGEFFVRLDSDDRMHPRRLIEQVSYLNDHPDTVLIGSQVAWIDENGERLGAFEIPSGADVRRELLRENVVPHSSWAARITVLRAVGGYSEDMPQMEDYDLLLRTACQGRIAVLTNELTEYRLHSNQMSKAVKPWGHYIRRIALRRRQLAEVIRASTTELILARLWWESMQWLMYFGRKFKR